MLIKNIIYFFLILIKYANGHDNKGSLTFVIDDTGSMFDDISQIKTKTNEILDAVVSSNASKINEFVLVTFNDPAIRLRAKTRYKGVFKRALKSIKAEGGDDCPELSMNGIQYALENSKPNSFVYVFTDASAKDHDKIERVTSLSQKKSTQVTFLLTGDCGNLNGADYVVYDKLAEATSGQVFHIEKNDIHEVFDYIIATIKHRETTLAQKILKNGRNHKLWFTVDSKEWDVLVSVASSYPDFKIFDSNGNLVETEVITRTDKTNIRKLTAGPGNYYVSLNSSSGTSVKVTASTSVIFQYGFSVYKPASLYETATMPIPGQKSYLSIALENHEKDIILDTAFLRDMNDSIIMQVPLTLIDEEKQLYLTDPIDAPEVMFKIEVEGSTPTKERILRVSPTAVEPQKPIKYSHEIKKKSPTVKILSDANIKIDYGQPLKVKCKVHGYPKPDVIWEGVPAATSTMAPLDFPYDFVSVLSIDKVTENFTVTCKAVNSKGRDSHFVKVEVKSYLTILEYPRDVVVTYGDSFKLKCVIDAFPPASITWYKNHEKIKVDNDDFEISSNNSVLIIKKMHMKLIDEYSVKVVSDIEEKEFNFNVTTLAEKPEIDKGFKHYVGEQGSPVSLNCRIWKGISKPAISWKFNDIGNNIVKELNVTTETLYIDKVTKDDAGKYTCSARNEMGEDSHVFELIVVYPPIIEEGVNYIRVTENDIVKIICSVDGYPLPEIQWFKNNIFINDTSKYRTYVQNVLRFKASREDAGDYTCIATNFEGQAKKITRVVVDGPVIIEPPKENVLSFKVGNSLSLPCVTSGYPKPSVQWSFEDFDRKITMQLSGADENNTLIIPEMKLENEGFYTCTARNFAKSVSITYIVHVEGETN